MEYHLYLDESGSFAKADEKKCAVIGGFMCAVEDGEKPFTRETAEEWRREIRQELVRDGLQTEQTLRSGEEWKALRALLARDPANEEIQKKIRSLEASGYYVFDHCTENSELIRREKESGRTGTEETVRAVLQAYCSRITERLDRGQLVIFRAPANRLDVDDNTTYMTVMAVGLMELYRHLRKLNNGQPVRISVHAASRKNMVLYYGTPEQLRDTPLPDTDNDGGTGRTLTASQYRNQLKNFAFLCGGTALSKTPEFREMLEGLEIVSDTFERGRQIPHPYTVICDYVCNRYKRSVDYKDAWLEDFFKRLKKDGRLKEIHTNPNNKEFRSENYNLDVIAREHDWGNGFVAMISRGRQLPKKQANEYFDALARDTRYDQGQLGDVIAEYLRPFAAGRENMDIWAKILRRIIACCPRFEEQAGLYIKAQMQLYLITLYTHLGKTRERDRAGKDFLTTVHGIRDMDRQVRLVLLYANRELVTAVDRFDYEGGRRMFDAVNRYYEDHMYCCGCLFDAVDDLKGVSRGDEELCLPEYGRVLGSFCQLLTHALRTADPDEIEELRKAGKDALERMPGQFTAPGDVSRCRQNLCGLCREEGKYLESLRWLYLACRPADDGQDGVPGAPEQAGEILRYAGKAGEKSRFVFLHYLNLLVCALADPDSVEARETAGAMLPLLDGRSMANFAANADNPYPDAVILWRAASVFCLSGQAGTCGLSVRETFDFAYKLLNGQEGRQRQAMSIALRAEELYHMRQGTVACTAKGYNERLAQLQKRYNKFMQTQDCADPFAEYGEALLRDGVKPDTLWQISRLIAY